MSAGEYADVLRKCAALHDAERAACGRLGACTLRVVCQLVGALPAERGDVPVLCHALRYARAYSTAADDSAVTATAAALLALSYGGSRAYGYAEALRAQPRVERAWALRGRAPATRVGARVGALLEFSCGSARAARACSVRLTVPHLYAALVRPALWRAHDTALLRGVDARAPLRRVLAAAQALYPLLLEAWDDAAAAAPPCTRACVVGVLVYAMWMSARRHDNARSPDARQRVVQRALERCVAASASAAADVAAACARFVALCQCSSPPHDWLVHAVCGRGAGDEDGEVEFGAEHVHVAWLVLVAARPPPPCAVR